MNRKQAIEILGKHIHTNSIYKIEGVWFYSWTKGEDKFKGADKDSRFTLVSTVHNDIRMQEERTYRFTPYTK